MTVLRNDEGAQVGWMRIDLVGNATAVGAVGEVLNPEGKDLHIIDGLLYFEAPSTLTSQFNIGIGATGVDASDLMSSFDMDKVAGTVWRVIGTDLATEGQLASPRGVNWDAAEYLTITSASQVSTGLLATLLIRYLNLADLAQ